VLADVASTHVDAMSGTIVETARLGLPDLPSTGSTSAQFSLQNLVTGSHTARVWLDGADKQRIALVGDLAESDAVHNGSDVWIYSSSLNTATHLTLKGHAGDAGKAADAMPSPVETPSKAASDIVAAASPTTRISVDATARVAGRPVYQIVLVPKDPASLITSVTIALDSQTKVPLRVQVYGQDRSTPAFETAFTDITFATPPASVFHFVPPTGAKVEQQSSATQLLTGPKVFPDGVGQAAPKASRAGGGTRVIGSGWTAVVVTQDSSLTSLLGGDGVSGAGGRTFRGSASDLASVLSKAMVKVPQGMLLRTALVSILVADDGRMYVGAVSGTALQAVAASGRAA
jgi:outer membrane lipoprotein-sorting protein